MNESFCPSCGASSPNEVTTCARCDVLLTPKASDESTARSANNQGRLRNCPDCGHACSVSAPSCPNCGCPFIEVAHTPANIPNSTDGDVKHGRKKLLAFTALAVVLVAGLASVIYVLYARYTREIDLHGEVFIVTNGRQNIKLGLVEITAVPEEQIQRFVEKKLTAINLEYSKYKSLEQSNSAQMENAQRAVDSSKTQYDLLHGQVEAARAAANKAEEDASSSIALAGYDSPQEVSAYQAALLKAETLKRRADQLDAQLATARSDLEMKKAALTAATSASRDQLKKVIGMLDSEHLFEGVPVDGPKAVTNSDGQFSIKLRANRKYVIAAKAQRKVFDSTEHYYWLVWVSADGDQAKSVMLTNNNLMGEDSPDAVFKPKDLIPTDLTEH